MLTATVHVHSGYSRYWIISSGVSVAEVSVADTVLLRVGPTRFHLPLRLLALLMLTHTGVGAVVSVVIC